MIRGSQRRAKPKSKTPARRAAPTVQPKATEPKAADPPVRETVPATRPKAQPPAAQSAQSIEELAVAGLSKDQLQGMQNQGMEDISFQDVLIPRLLIAQAQSNQLDDNNAQYIEGSEAGHVCNTGMKSAYESILFCPVAYRKLWIEWPPREQQQNRIVQMHTDPAILRECQRDGNMWTTPEGNQIQETAQFYGWQLEEGGGVQECFLPMASTQLRKSRQWLTMAQAEEIEKDGNIFKAPLWWRVYELTSQKEHNDQGRWHGWAISRDITLAEWAHANNRDFNELIAQANNLNSSIAQIMEQADQGQALLEEKTQTTEGAQDTGEPTQEEVM